MFGSRVYYDNRTGEVLVKTSEGKGATRQTTVDEDFESFPVLSSRNKETISFIQLEYGQYAEDFAMCSGYRVNPETKQLEFSYPDSSATEPQEQVFQKPFTEQVIELKQELALSNALILELMENLLV